MSSLAIDVQPDTINFTIYIPSVKGHILQSTRHRCSLQGDEVLVKITHTGLSSLNVYHQFTSHQAHGNTGVGIVQEVGPNVMDLKRNDGVGFSYARITCGTCQNCLKRCFDFCPSRVSYGDPIRGIATYTVRREEFLFKIPSAIDKTTAAALFNVLDTYHVKYEDRVGIVGVGRMGRLAIQFAAKLGCNIVVFSRTADKLELAMSLGAKEYYTTTGRQQLQIAKPLSHLLLEVQGHMTYPASVGTFLHRASLGQAAEAPLDSQCKLLFAHIFQHLLLTTSVPPDWSFYIALLAPGAVIYPLTLGAGSLEIPVMEILSCDLRIQGSLSASNKVAVKTLEFAAREGIKPQTKPFELDATGIERALWWMERGSGCERAVLVARNEEDERVAEVGEMEKSKPCYFHEELV